MTLIGLVGVAAQSSGPARQAPRFWNDRELAEWATPIAALDVRPSHFSEREYYAAPEAEWVRTYPVYFPGREPAGYWEMLRARKPEPLIAPGARTEAEWIDSGRRVFEEMDVPDLPEHRSADHRHGAVGGGARAPRRTGPEGRQSPRFAVGADVQRPGARRLRLQRLSHAGSAGRLALERCAIQCAVERRDSANWSRAAPRHSFLAIRSRSRTGASSPCPGSATTSTTA